MLWQRSLVGRAVRPYYLITSNLMVDAKPNTSVRDLVNHVGALITSIFEKAAKRKPLPTGLNPPELAATFNEEIPQEGMPVRDVLQIIEQKIIRTALNLANPMTFGLMTPHPLPLPAVLDGLISALNQNLGCAWRTAPSGIEVELRTIKWLCQLFGLPQTSGGHFTTGGAASNLTAIRLALHRQFPETRTRGLIGLKSQPVLYVSDQGHFSVDRAAGVLGVGEQNVRKIASRADLTIDLDKLTAAIQQDRENGLAPFVVVGTAGTTAAGGIDPLERLSEICDRENLWFHVDAAYAGALALSDRLRANLRGVERADSITVDPHKWMFIPFSLGAVLTRHPHLLRSAFGEETAYLGREHTADAEAAPCGFYEVSLDVSRRFNGLKLWATMKHLGVSGLAEIIERQVRLTDLLCERLGTISGIELAPRSATNIVCFRLAPAKTDETTRDSLQSKLQAHLEREAGWWLSSATLQGKRFLRINLLHHGLQTEHVERIAAAVSKAVDGVQKDAADRTG